MDKAPLFYSSVKCPICGSDNKFENLKKGAYRISGVDTDFMPLGIVWSSNEMTGINPLLYFIATCPNCFYSAEFNDKLKEWTKNTHFRTYKLPALKEKHLAALDTDDSLLQLIGGVLDPKNYPYETAICKIILAIYDERLNSHPSFLSIGRFYLRIGWLFRELGIVKSQTTGKRGGLVSELNGKINSLESNLYAFKDSIKELALFYNENSDTLFGNKNDKTPNVEVSKQLNLLNDLLHYSKESISRIDLLRDFAAKEITSIDMNGEQQLIGFKNFPDFRYFLEKVKKLMPELPTNEEEALKYAKEYYKKCSEGGRELKDGSQSLQAFYLIGELARRVGDFEESKKYFNSTINGGRTFIMNRANAIADIQRVKSIVEKATTQAKKVFEMEKSAKSIKKK